jgi:DNA-binding transcriptional MerR regulator
MHEIAIGDAARISGVKVTTIRFYEDRGLLPIPPRSDGNRRIYARSDIARLQFIRHARDLGFALGAIETLLNLSDHPDRPCAEIDALAQQQLAEVDRRIAQLTALRLELGRITVQCAGGTVADCGVIACLADHALCRGDHSH